MKRTLLGFTNHPDFCSTRSYAEIFLDPGFVTLDICLTKKLSWSFAYARPNVGFGVLLHKNYLGKMCQTKGINQQKVFSWVFLTRSNRLSNRGSSKKTFHESTFFTSKILRAFLLLNIAQFSQHVCSFILCAFEEPSIYRK